MEQVRASPAPYFGQVLLHLCLRCKLGQELSALSTLQQSACGLCWSPAAVTEYLLVNKLAVLDAGSQVNFADPSHVSRLRGIIPLVYLQSK